MRSFVAALFTLACHGAAAQDMMIFDPSSFGDIVLPQRQAAIGEPMLEAGIGAYNNEFISNYGANSIFARVGRPVGRLDILTDKGHAPCTAFLVAENRLITNHHCVPGILKNAAMLSRGATSIVSVKFQAGFVKDGVETGVRSYFVDPEPLETIEALDYTLLQLIGDANAEFGALELSTALPGDRDPLWVIGHPMGEAQRISREKCAAAEPALDGKRLRHTCDTLPGNSGSPVIDAGLQKVVALHHAGSRASDVNFAFPMAEIIAQSGFLKASDGPAGDDGAARELAALKRQLEEARQAQRQAEEAARLAREKAEAEKLAERRKLAEEMAAVAKAAEDARLAREKAEAERLALEEARRAAEADRRRAAEDRAAAERAEAERLAREQAEADRKARAEAERRALADAARAEAERLADTRAEARRKAEDKVLSALADAERAEREAEKMLTSALTLDDAVQLLALKRIIRQFPETEAGEKAASALAALEAGMAAEKTPVTPAAPVTPWQKPVLSAFFELDLWGTLAVSPDGGMVARSRSVEVDKGSLDLWDPKTQKATVEATIYQGVIRTMVFSEDGSRLFAGLYDGGLRMIDPASGKVLKSVQAHGNIVHDVAVARDGRHLLSGSEDGTASYWDMENRIRKFAPIEVGAPVLAVAVSPDGKTLATGTSTRRIDLWQADTGRRIRMLQGASDWIYGLTFSPDGARLMSTDGEGAVMLWDVETGKPLIGFEGEGMLARAAAFSSDGAYFATGSNKGTVRVWSATTGKFLAELRALGAVLQLRFLSGGTDLAIVTKQGRYQVHARD